MIEDHNHSKVDKKDNDQVANKQRYDVSFYVVKVLAWIGVVKRLI